MGSAGGSSDAIDSSGLGLRGGDVILASGDSVPVQVLVDITVGLSGLADGFSVPLDGGFVGSEGALDGGAVVVLGGDGGVDGGGLGVAGVDAVS